MSFLDELKLEISKKSKIHEEAMVALGTKFEIEKPVKNRKYGWFDMKRQDQYIGVEQLKVLATLDEVQAKALVYLYRQGLTPKMLAKKLPNSLTQKECDTLISRVRPSSRWAESVPLDNAINQLLEERNKNTSIAAARPS